MAERLRKFVDSFIPDRAAGAAGDRAMARTFVGLHLIGPLMGHSVTYFLAISGAALSWQFWLIEAIVAGFFLIPLLLRVTGSLRVAAMASTQMLIFLSLFGSFYFGGMGSPFLPWFLIAMILGFFYLAKDIVTALTGLVIQIVAFAVGRFASGGFPEIIPASDLANANILSVAAALTYMTLLSLYYEVVMRVNGELELTAHDQRQKLDQLREAMQSAETASMRKSIFLAKMSHELRTPLNAVIGYSELLMDCYEDKRSTRKIQDLERIRAAGRHLLALVNNVIDISSIESDRVELNSKPTDLRQLMNEVVATAEPLIAKRQNRLDLSIDPELGIVDLDAMKLKQSLLNLLSNAAKFTTRGHVQCSVRGDRNPTQPMLVFEVADDGIGMTRAGAQRLFSDFSQAEDDTAKRYGGSGLGLALTQRFCEMMGGSIRVQSQRGVGSVFTIVIPWRSCGASAPRAEAA